MTDFKTDNDASDPLPAAAAPLPGLAASLFTGPDCAKFLQGYLTCDTQSLMQPEQHSGTPAVPAALCNIKGRVVANGWAFAMPGTPDAIAVITHTEVAERLRQALQPYMVFSKTVSEPLPASVFGAVDSPPIAGAIALDTRRHIYLAATGAGLAQQPQSAFTNSLLEDRQVLVSAASAETYLPQMLGLSAWGAIDFTKGCYLGQEVVARAEHRGQVKRQLMALTATTAIDAAFVPPTGAAVQDQSGKVLGSIVQVRDGAAAVNSVLALAVLNGAAREQTKALRIEGSEIRATVVANGSDALAD